ncbi:MAG: hypothetical protein RIQ53_256 [Pseudomonadota bacterium]
MRCRCASSCRPIALALLRVVRPDAGQIGDDTLQRKGQGTVVPESFTHGSSAQRVSWFRRGHDSGQTSQCNTFAAVRETR